MITFNFSMDYEMGWGDLGRLARDDVFYGRVVSGVRQTEKVIEVLSQHRIPSTWGVVGACCGRSLEELRMQAPRAYSVVLESLDAVTRCRSSFTEALFCRDMIQRIGRSEWIELASHGFLHVTPTEAASTVLQDDVSASARVLREATGKDVESFIPPQNYHWPDEVFAGSGIRFIRHTPNVLGYPYSDARKPAKFARLWNDFIHPARYHAGSGKSARLLFLRIDRGKLLWNAQLTLIRSLLSSKSGALYCYSHPHNLDTPESLSRLAQLCDLVAAASDRGQLQFGGFVRDLSAAPARVTLH